MLREGDLVDLAHAACSTYRSTASTDSSIPPRAPWRGRADGCGSRRSRRPQASPLDESQVGRRRHLDEAGIALETYAAPARLDETSAVCGVPSSHGERVPQRVVRQSLRRLRDVPPRTRRLRSSPTDCAGFVEATGRPHQGRRGRPSARVKVTTPADPRSRRWASRDVTSTTTCTCAAPPRGARGGIEHTPEAVGALRRGRGQQGLRRDRLHRAPLLPASSTASSSTLPNMARDRPRSRDVCRCHHRGEDRAAVKPAEVDWYRVGGRARRSSWSPAIPGTTARFTSSTASRGHEAGPLGLLSVEEVVAGTSRRSACWPGADWPTSRASGSRQDLRIRPAPLQVIEELHTEYAEAVADGGGKSRSRRLALRKKVRELYPALNSSPPARRAHHLLRRSVAGDVGRDFDSGPRAPAATGYETITVFDLPSRQDPSDGDFRVGVDAHALSSGPVVLAGVNCW